jgi:hypothetical protein
MGEQLSCTTCRTRKTKCDKSIPCAGCKLGGFECVYPTHRRKMRDSRKQLAQRLQAIENKFAAFAQLLVSGNDNVSLARQTPGGGIGKDSTPQLQDASVPRAENLLQTHGKLSVVADQSRYSNSSLWASLGVDVRQGIPLNDD